MSERMRAWQISQHGSPAQALQSVGDRPVPEPGPGEVLLQVGAAGIGLPDVMMCRGTYAFSPSFPFVPGQEVVGVVRAAGEGSQWRPGQRAMGVTAFYEGHGAFADFCIAPDFSLYPVPDGMADPEAAGFCIPFHTAWVGLQLRAGLREGEVLVVHGAAGGTGAAAIRLGGALGAQVIATAGGAAKIDYCRALGASHCIDHREQDVVEQILALTDGRGADVIYDPVGGELFERSVACTASGGRLLAVGYASGRWGAPDSRELVMRNCAALGVFVGAHGHDELLDVHARLSELYTQGRIAMQPDVTATFGALADTLTAMESRELIGKAILHVSNGA